MDGLPRIAGFQFYEQIAETSRSMIWRAKQDALERDVLVQILRADAAEKPIIREHFFTVVRAMARIKSQLFPSVLDVVYEGDMPYVIVEDDHAESLTALLKKGAMPMHQLLEIALKFCEGFKVLNEEAHLVYRNLKPSIIRVMEGCQPRLVDLSLAIFEAPNCRATELDGGVIIGTPSYISPEQYRAPDSLDTRSDMYTLGATLYTLATGETPFGHLEPMAAIRAKLAQQLPSPSDRNSQISRTFSAFIARLMMRAPEDRFASWDDALDAIGAMYDGRDPPDLLPEGYAFARSTVAAPSATPPRNLRKPPTRELSVKADQPAKRSPAAGHVDDGAPHFLLVVALYLLLFVAAALLGALRWKQLERAAAEPETACEQPEMVEV